MERGEGLGQNLYSELADEVPHGLITGIAAWMAMAASEYLATTEETGSSKRAIPAAPRAPPSRGFRKWR